jgi:hypothetical protein
MTIGTMERVLFDGMFLPGKIASRVTHGSGTYRKRETTRERRKSNIGIVF